jgi:murein DD-endopeptidase MepM/ murein hydrolase activator NlpD
MRKLLLLLLIIASHHINGQSVDPRFESVVGKFQQYYNQGAHDSIFSLLSPSMQQHLPPRENHSFFSGLKADAGKMMKREAVEIQPREVTYKTTFQKGVFAFNISLDDNSKINGFAIKPYFSDSLPKLDRNITALEVPFSGSWTVVWGGDTPEQNYHIDNQAQKGAFDFLIVGKNGKTYRSDGRTNEDYYAFGQEITAPCDAEVVMVVDGIKDNVPGEMNPVYIPGNTVVLKSAAGEHLVFAHLQQGSVTVRQGEKVKQGQVVGLCGNSGNSSEPHLHFHLQNVEEMYKATGAKVYFENILVDGELQEDYSPVKGQVVQRLSD